MMMIRRKPELKRGWFESWIDDTNIIEKLIFLIWFGMIGIFYIMFDMFNMWIRILVSIGSFTILSVLIYWFGIFMSSKDRNWN
tara:strand:- start:190 stop:438 length:249 start_codon:yes stop_codon:yes gene_type:complete